MKGGGLFSSVGARCLIEGIASVVVLFASGLHFLFYFVCFAFGVHVDVPLFLRAALVFPSVVGDNLLLVLFLLCVLCLSYAYVM